MSDRPIQATVAVVLWLSRVISSETFGWSLFLVLVVPPIIRAAVQALEGMKSERVTLGPDRIDWIRRHRREEGHE